MELFVHRNVLARKFDMKPQDFSKKKKKQFTGDEPRVSKPTFRTVYNASVAIKTVIVDPFDKDVFQQIEFMTWLDETSSYTIKKKKDKCLAELIFPTIARGDAAYSDLKQNLKLNVYHPHLNSRLSDNMPGTSQKNILEEQMKELEPTGDIWERIVVLEGARQVDREQLKDEEKLVDVFPDALNILVFQYDPRTAGIVALELPSIDAAKKFVQKYGPRTKFTIDGQGVLVDVFRYYDRVNIYDKIRETDTAVKDAQNKLVQEDLSDRRRIELNQQYHNLNEEMENVHAMDELFGDQKMEKYIELLTELRECKRLLCKDTRRRLKNKSLKLPEPDDKMHLFTIDLIKNHKGFVGSANQDRVKTQLQEYDEQYENLMKEAEKLQHKICSTEGQLDPQEKLKRQASKWAKTREHSTEKKTNEKNMSEKNVNQKTKTRPHVEPPSYKYDKTKNASNFSKPPSLMSVEVPAVVPNKGQKRPGTQNSMVDEVVAPKKGFITRNERFPANSDFQGYGNDRNSKIQTSFMDSNATMSINPASTKDFKDRPRNLMDAALDRRMVLPAQPIDQSMDRIGSSNSQTSFIDSNAMRSFNQSSANPNFKDRPRNLMDAALDRPIDLLTQPSPRPRSLMDAALDRPIDLLSQPIDQSMGRIDSLVELRDIPQSLLAREKPTSLFDKPPSLFDKSTGLYDSSADTFDKPRSIMDPSFDRPVGNLMDPDFDRPMRLMDDTLMNRPFEARNTPTSVLESLDRPRSLMDSLPSSSQSLQYGFTQQRSITPLASIGLGDLPSDSDIEIRARLAVAEKKKALMQRMSMLGQDRLDMRDNLYLPEIGNRRSGRGKVDYDRDDVDLRDNLYLAGAGSRQLGRKDYDRGAANTDVEYVSPYS